MQDLRLVELVVDVPEVSNQDVRNVALTVQEFCVTCFQRVDLTKLKVKIHLVVGFTNLEEIILSNFISLIIIPAVQAQKVLFYLPFYTLQFTFVRASFLEEEKRGVCHNEQVSHDRHQL